MNLSGRLPRKLRLLASVGANTKPVGKSESGLTCVEGHDFGGVGIRSSGRNVDLSAMPV